MQKYSKFAQLMLGAAYRTYATITSWMGVVTKHCSHVSRGGNRQPITTCVGQCTGNLHVCLFLVLLTTKVW